MAGPLTFWGTASRLSPEAAVPVVDFVEQSECLGGAGNVCCESRHAGRGAWKRFGVDRPTTKGRGARFAKMPCRAANITDKGNHRRFETRPPTVKNAGSSRGTSKVGAAVDPRNAASPLRAETPGKKLLAGLPFCRAERNWTHWCFPNYDNKGPDHRRLSPTAFLSAAASNYMFLLFRESRKTSQVYTRIAGAPGHRVQCQGSGFYVHRRARSRTKNPWEEGRPRAASRISGCGAEW